MADAPPNDPGAAGTLNSPQPHEGGTHKRSVVWMVVAGVAILAAIGLGAWASYSTTT